MQYFVLDGSIDGRLTDERYEDENSLQEVENAES